MTARRWASSFLPRQIRSTDPTLPLRRRKPPFLPAGVGRSGWPGLDRIIYDKWSTIAVPTRIVPTALLLLVRFFCPGQASQTNGDLACRKRPRTPRRTSSYQPSPTKYSRPDAAIQPRGLPDRLHGRRVGMPTPNLCRLAALSTFTPMKWCQQATGAAVRAEVAARSATPSTPASAMSSALTCRSLRA